MASIRVQSRDTVIEITLSPEEVSALKQMDPRTTTPEIIDNLLKAFFPYQPKEGRSIRKAAGLVNSLVTDLRSALFSA